MNLSKHDREPFRGPLFMEIYKEELERLEQEYDYRFFSDKARIKIFMRDTTDLNILCRNKLHDMNDELLTCFIAKEKGMLMVLRRSNLLMEALLKKGIGVHWMFWRGRHIAIFHTTTLDRKQMLKSLEETMRFDYQVLEFGDRSITFD